MGYYNHEITRTDDRITVIMGGRQTEKRARAFIKNSETLKPWEEVFNTVTRSGDGWTFTVDTQASHVRKQVIDLVVADMNESPGLDDLESYLEHLRDTLDILAEASE